MLFIISADCLDVPLPCRPLPKPNNLYLYLIGHPAHQRSYDLFLLLHYIMASTALHYYTYLAKNLAFPASLYCSLPLRHDLCLTSQLSTALLYYSLTAWYYPHHSHLLPTTTRRFTSVHYHSNLPIPPPLFVTRRSISLLQLLPIITQLCLALRMQWSITLTTSNTSHKYLPLRIVAMPSRIAPHYSL